MKRLCWGLLTAVFCIISFLGGLYLTSLREEQREDCDTEGYVDSELFQEIASSLEINYYLYSVNHPIEKSYIEDTWDNDGSTGSMVQLYNKYAELWKTEMETYSTLIQAELYDDPDTLESFQMLEQTWENSKDKDIVTYSKIQNSVHDNGSIRAQNAARYTMELYRAQALKLITIYQELMTGRGWTWKIHNG